MEDLICPICQEAIPFPIPTLTSQANIFMKYTAGLTSEKKWLDFSLKFFSFADVNIEKTGNVTFLHFQKFLAIDNLLNKIPVDFPDFFSQNLDFLQNYIWKFSFATLWQPCITGKMWSTQIKFQKPFLATLVSLQDGVLVPRIRRLYILFLVIQNAENQ